MDSLNVFVKNGTNTDALHVKVIEMLNDVPTEGEQITSDTSVLYSSRDVNAPIAITEMPTKKKKKKEADLRNLFPAFRYHLLGLIMTMLMSRMWLSHSLTRGWIAEK